MATYIFLVEAPGNASAGILYSSVDGAEQQRNAIGLLGGKVIAQYAVLGRYDEVLIVDFPDEESALAFNLRLNAEGLYGEAMRAFTPEDVVKATKYIELLDSIDNQQE